MLGRDPGELQPSHLAIPERLGDGDRAIAELELWRQQLQLDRRTEQGVERQQRLEPGNATARDDDLRAIVHGMKL